jgi:PAS domain S-box-containing protein
MKAEADGPQMYDVESLARLAIENPQPLLRVDANGHVLFANAAGAVLLGHSGPRDDVPPRLRAAAETALGSGQTGAIEFEAGGRIYSFTIIPARDPDGRFASLYGTDITDPRATEQALRRHAALIDLSPDAIIVRRLEGTITFWSRGAVAMYGWSAEEAVGQSINSLLRTRFPQPLAEIVRHLQRHSHWTGTLTHLTREGREVLVQSYWRAQFDAAGDVVELLESNVDITLRAQIEQALRTTNEQLLSHQEELAVANEELQVQAEELVTANEELVQKSVELKTLNEQLVASNQALQKSEETARRRAEEVEALMNLIPTAVWVSQDPQCRVITGNQAANHFYEAQPGDNVSAGPQQGVQDLTRRFFHDRRELQPEELPMQEAAALNRDVRDSEVDVLLPSGRWMTILGNASPLRDPAGRVRGCIASFIDITERSLAEAERERLLAAEAQARQAAEQRAERLGHLQRLSASLAAALRLDDVAGILFDHFTSALGAHAGSLALLSADGSTLHLVKAFGYPENVVAQWQQFPTALATSPLSVAVRENQPVWVESPQERMGTIGVTPGRPVDTSHQAWAALPLAVHGRVIGGLGLSFAQPTLFDDEVRSFALALVDQCAQAGERARLFEAEAQARRSAERATNDITRIQTVTAELSRARTPAQVVDVIIHHGMAALGASAAAVYALSQDGAALEHLGESGFPEAARLSYARIPMDLPIAATDAARSGEIVWVESNQALLERYPHLAGRRNTNFEAVICAPLIVDNRIDGVLTFSFAGMRPETLREREFIATLARQCAQALDRAKLFEAEAQARHEAERQNELRLRFLAMISHELRTPLQSIKGFATTLLSDDVTWDAASQRDFIQIIDTEADKLTDMIEQVLDLSRLEAGALRIDPRTVTIEDVLATVWPQLQALAAEHSLSVHAPADLPAVRADSQRICQVLINLVGNAVKYSPPGTAIEIAAAPAADRLQVCVSDQGPGIRPEERARVFEAFRRGDDERVRRSKGAGLGLAICKGIVEAHGGSIWIEERTGQDDYHGATICFTLPTQN